MDALELSIAEREITALRIAKLKDNPVKGNFDLKHLQKIHKYIFSDIYSWAGEIRTVNISKGNQFCRSEHIVRYSSNVFTKLFSEHFLILTNSSDIARQLAYYLGEINVIHPFREGNGRAQRVFIEYLGRVAGYDIDFSTVTDREMIKASALAFNCDYTKMTDIFKRIITDINIKDQEENISLVLGKNSDTMKIFHDCKQNNINRKVIDNTEKCR